MHRVLKYWFVLLAFTGCGQRHELGSELAREDPGAIASEAFPAAGQATSGPPLFTSLPAGVTGIDFTHRLDLSHPLKRLYHGGFATGGIAIGDLDGDSLPDVYFVSGPARNQLYRNLGGLRFEVVTGPGLDGGDRWGTGAAMADIDNDGDLDLYVCNYQSPNQLFINGGDMQFSEQAEGYGLDFSDGSLMPSFCDYDNDGDLDCFVLTYRLYREGGWPQEARYEMRDGLPVIKEAYRDFYKVAQSGEVDGKPQWSVEYVGRRDRLFRNDGAGNFEDVSEASGITGRGHGLSATWWDADGDGWMDLYVGNDFNEPDRFYRNLGDGRFEDVVREAVPHTSWFSMGADFADLDNDGRFDFLVADMSSRTHFDQKVNMGAMGNSRWFLENAQPPQYMRNALFLNSGTWRFNEAAYLSGLADTDWTWAVKLADFDNDGRVDAYFSNGAARNFTDSDKRVGTLRGRTQWDAFEDGPMRKERNLGFKNMGALSFENVSEDWGLNHEGVSYAAAVGDLDRDGDLDLVVGNLEEPVSIYRNNSSGGGISIQLCGTSANRFGFGAWVEVRTPSGVQVRQLAPASGFLSSNEPLLHFGTGGEAVDELTVRWPGGKMQRFGDLETGRRYRITEGDHHLVPAASAVPLFAEIPDALGGHRHREQEFDDFAVQPLLPNRLSRLGPGVAASSRGEMLWLGGAKGQAGEIRHGAEVIFRAEADSECEDMGAVFFDADGDGDEDLYVVSGGVECQPGDAALRDRLYLNDGGASFEKAALPDLRDSGGPVAAADFDRDGDLDLFVGGRVVPGRYPLAPQSRLLVNLGGGEFEDQTDALAPDLLSTGMATSAIWSDVDGDAWIDLLVTYEWGPVRVWKNVEGNLTDHSEAAGTADLLGWWNAIAAGDFDADGDIDFAVGNVGLNTKYTAPALLYYGDFDGSGKKQLVEAELEDSVLYPVRGKSCSTEAIPGLADRFQTYRDFAAASLQTIYTQDSLATAMRLEANTLASGVLQNLGDGRLAFVPFTDPLAQIAPCDGIAVDDFDGDGNGDLFLAQNSFSPQPETGRMDGGLSTVLLGDGSGGFTALRAAESGIAIAADANCTVVSGRTLYVGTNDGKWRGFERRPAK